MRCMLCNAAETLLGLTTVLLARHEVALTFNNVPAQICPNCGEAYADEFVASNLLHQAEKLAKAGTKVETCEYQALKT